MFKDKFKIFKKNEEEGNKKKIENIVFLIILLIITIVIINVILKEDTSSDEENTDSSSEILTSSSSENTDIASYTYLAENLEEILATIKGVGEVNVFINYSESSQIVAMYDETTTTSTTEEEDTSGGTRNTVSTETQKEIIYSDEDGDTVPVTEKVIMPTIEGAIITAQGATNATVKSYIISAVEAATGLSSDKIQVFEME